MAITALLPLGLAFLMLVVGLRLSAADFTTLLRAPKAVLVGGMAQIVGLPLAAFVVARVLNLSPELTLGLLVVAAAPGGITSNFIAVLARADVALSTTMTLGTSLLAAATIPLVLTLSGAVLPGGGGSLVLGIGRTALALMVVSALPLLAGMAIRAFAPGFTTRWMPLLDRISTLVFFAIVLATFIQNGPAMVAHAATAGPAAVLLNLAAIAIAYAAGRGFALPPSQTLAVALECGLQNVAMAIFVSNTVLNQPSLVVPALVYAVVMNVTALILVGYGRRTAPAI